MTTLATLFLSLFPFVGAQVFIEPGQTPAQIDSWFSTLEDSGLSTCRIRMFESYMRTPDGWDFSLFDSAFESAERHGIGIWCTLFPATEKTDIGGWKFPYDEAQKKSFAEFISALVGHYKDSPALKGWVLINEPGVHSVPDTPFVEAARARWKKVHPGAEFKENGYPVLMDLSEARFLSDLNTEFLQWIASEIARHDTAHDIHVNPHAVFELYSQHDFPSYRKFLSSLGGSAHPAWHFGFFDRQDYSLAMMAESEILRSAAGPLPWFMTEIQGGNNTYSGLNALCPTPDEIRQWLWSVIACEGRGAIFWMLNPRSSGIEAGEWAMIDFQGKPTARLEAASEVARTLQASPGLFSSLKEIPSGIDVVYVRESSWAEALMAKEGDPIEARRPGGVTKSALACWRALSERGMNVGIKAFGEYDFTLDDYSGRTVILSHQIALPDECLPPLKHFVEHGGTLIVEGLTGFFDSDLHCTMNTGFAFADLLGGEISEFILKPSALWRGLYAAGTPVRYEKYGREKLELLENCDGRIVWLPSSVALEAWGRGNFRWLSNFLARHCNFNPAATSFLRGYRKGVLMHTLESSEGKVVIAVNKSGRRQCLGVKGLSLHRARVLYSSAGCRRGLFGSLRLGREGVLVLMIPSEVKR